MKKVVTVILCVFMVAAFMLFALGSGSDSGDGDGNQGTGSADVVTSDNTALNKYSVEIKSCRLSKDYDNKPVVIVKYGFTNNDEEPASFMLAFEDNVYQDGIGLNEAYFLVDSADYSADNQSKEIKTGATLDVEVAYVLNDTTTDIEVEVSELFSWDDKAVKKTFSIA
ncbi:MAG: DUF5067 domain-containing protein [Clostridia bacterium]|nr:DUF5067 domain-containing protein [Clostridia bacterium]